MTLTTKLRAGISAIKLGSSDFGTDKLELSFPSDYLLSNGTASGLADLLFADSRTLSASGSEDLDLAGVLSTLGETVTFVRVKAIYIKAAAGNGGNIVVGGASPNGFLGPFADATDQLQIPADGFAMLAAPLAGWAVTAGTGDLLRVANSDGAAAATYEIGIVGTSA